MSDASYLNEVDANGVATLKVKPTTQAEADEIYDDLALALSPECVHADGENSEIEAGAYWNFYMRIALQVEICGFLPSNCSDVWSEGERPSSFRLR